MIVPFDKAPSRMEAEAIIRKLAVNGAISWSRHAKERMIERNIATPQIINCLIKGKVIEEPTLNYTNGGGYETAVEKYCAGDWLKVVVCIKFSERLLIVTVY